MAHTLEELYARQSDSSLRNRVEAALLKRAAADITNASPENAEYAKQLFNVGNTEAKRVLRYLVGKYPDVTEPTDVEIETAVAEVYPSL